MLRGNQKTDQKQIRMIAHPQKANTRFNRPPGIGNRLIIFAKARVTIGQIKIICRELPPPFLLGQENIQIPAGLLRRQGSGVPCMQNFNIGRQLHLRRSLRMACQKLVDFPLIAQKPAVPKYPQHCHVIQIFIIPIRVNINAAAEEAPHPPVRMIAPDKRQHLRAVFGWEIFIRVKIDDPFACRLLQRVIFRRREIFHPRKIV